MKVSLNPEAFTPPAEEPVSETARTLSDIWSQIMAGSISDAQISNRALRGGTITGRRVDQVIIDDPLHDHTRDALRYADFGRIEQRVFALDPRAEAVRERVVRDLTRHVEQQLRAALERGPDAGGNIELTVPERRLTLAMGYGMSAERYRDLYLTAPTPPRNDDD